jgi:hypothetical protein
MSSKERSTIPKVRRRAGQSIREEIERLFEDRLFLFVVAPVFFWVFFFNHWWQAYSKTPPQPRVFLALSILVTGVSIIGVLRLRPRIRALVRGERGERIVAEILEDLTESGYRSFHDLKRDGFNIDHVVVGPSGVFVIETKFRSGSGIINFCNGEGLFVNGAPFSGDRDPVAQALGNAAEIRKMIKEDCKIDVWTTAVVVFVGDWKVKETWRRTDARVVSESQLLRYFEKQDQPELKQSEITLIASHLERSVRS